MEFRDILIVYNKQSLKIPRVSDMYPRKNNHIQILLIYNLHKNVVMLFSVNLIRHSHQKFHTLALNQIKANVNYSQGTLKVPPQVVHLNFGAFILNPDLRLRRHLPIE